MPSLVITHSGRVTGTVRLEKDEVLLGRGQECDVVLPDVNASRVHARILREGDGYVVEDRGSHNGTTLNGARVERHALGDGDRIGIGGHEIEFRMAEEPAAVTAEAAGGGEDVSGRGVRTFDEVEDGQLESVLRGMLDQARRSSAEGDAPETAGGDDAPGTAGEGGAAAPGEGGEGEEAAAAFPLGLIVGLAVLVLAIIGLALLLAW